jgi:hypothetical protein
LILDLESSQGLVPTSQATDLNLAFASLVDATRYAKGHSDLLAKVDELKNANEKTKQNLDHLSDKFSTDIHSLVDELGTEWTEDLTKQIVSFSAAAIEQVKTKVDARTAKQLEDNHSLIGTEKTKSIKAIESFLSTNPLRLVEGSITVNFLQDGNYTAFSKYDCVNEIHYEFLLETKSSHLFRKDLKLSQFSDSEIKIPFRMAKSWVKKDPVFEYARLDQYTLTSAEATGSTLITICSDPYRKSHIKIVYSRREGTRPFLTIEYSDGISSTNVSSNPTLSTHLNVKSLPNIMERIWMGINDLEHHKKVLLKLRYRGRNILEDMDTSDFLGECWNVLAPQISNLMKGGEGSRRSEKIAENEVREKLKLLGPQGDDILRKMDLT